MRIATLNIRHGGGKRVSGLVSFTDGLKADCLLLTEFRGNRSGLELSVKLSELGYTHQSEITGDPRLNQLKWFSKHPFNLVCLPLTLPVLPAISTTDLSSVSFFKG